MGSYKFEVSKENKTFTIYFEGFFEKDAVYKFEAEYKRNVDLLDDSKQYELHLECRDMSVIKATLLKELGKCIEQYTKDFKDVIVVKDIDQKVLKKQTEVLMKKLNLIDKITVKEV